MSCGNVTCKEMIQGVRMEKHMAECKHRMVPCPSSACTSNMLLDTVSDHMKVHRALTGAELRLKVVHKAVTRNMNSEVSLPMSPYKNNANCNWVTMVFEVKGQQFYLQCLSRNKIFMAWVMVKGGREEASRWRATISVRHPKKIVTSESDVFPIDMTTEEIINFGDCFFMVDKELVKFHTSDEMPLNISLVKV